MAKRNDHLRGKAVALRGDGYTLTEISAMLALNKSTVYYWIKGTRLPQRTNKQTTAQRNGSAAFSAKWKKIRDDMYNMGLSEAKTLDRDLALRDFTLIYLTEGFRRTRNTVSVSNSNPHILSRTMEVLRRYSDKPVRATIQYYEDHAPTDLRAHWSKTLEIDQERIQMQPKSNSGRLVGRKWRSEFGVVSVAVDDTRFRSRVQGWMDGLQQQWQAPPKEMPSAERMEVAAQMSKL